MSGKLSPYFLFAILLPGNYSDEGDYQTCRKERDRPYSPSHSLVEIGIK